MKLHYTIMKIISLSMIFISGYSQSVTIEPTLISNASSAENNQLHWILGESFVEYKANNDIVLSEGFFQGLGLITNTEDENLLHDVKVFPNPFFNHLEILTIDGSDLECFLFDASGRLIKHNTINQTLRINFQSEESGIYYMLIKDKEKRTNTYKLFKAN